MDVYFQQAREKMRRHRVDVIEIIRSVVSLKTVTGIYQKDISETIGRAYTVDVIIHREDGFADFPVHISGIEPGPMHIIGGQDGQGVFAVLETTVAGQAGHGRGQDDDQMLGFHIVK